MTDYKQLCVELLAALENEGYAHWIRHTPDEDELCLRARTALSEPEPEVPTDEELFSLDQLRDKWNAQADAFNTWDELGIDEIVWWAQRQALARWGNRQGILDSSASKPIPVSERVRQVEDLAADAVGALRYIEQVYGRLYGVGWDRVYEKADHLRPDHALLAPS